MVQSYKKVLRKPNKKTPRNWFIVGYETLSCRPRDAISRDVG